MAGERPLARVGAHVELQPTEMLEDFLADIAGVLAEILPLRKRTERFNWEEEEEGRKSEERGVKLSKNNTLKYLINSFFLNNN